MPGFNEAFEVKFLSGPIVATHLANAQDEQMTRGGPPAGGSENPKDCPGGSDDPCPEDQGGG